MVRKSREKANEEGCGKMVEYFKKNKKRFWKGGNHVRKGEVRIYCQIKIQEEICSNGR